MIHQIIISSSGDYPSLSPIIPATTTQNYSADQTLISQTLKSVSWGGGCPYVETIEEYSKISEKAQKSHLFCMKVHLI